MATIEFEIFKTSDGRLSLTNESYQYNNEDWEQFLRQNGQAERAEHLVSLSSRKRSPKIWRIRQSKEFRQWSKTHVINVTSSLYGIASANYDGRIKEGRIKYAILDAIRHGQSEARYYPQSNKGKPAHLHMVYCFGYSFRIV